MNSREILDALQQRTEKFLTTRKYRKYKKQHRAKTFRSELLDWIYSLLYAVVVVFFVSLYFFQLFVVPSSSMENTLMVGDRVGVYKRAYGTELYSFGPKSAKKMANRGDVVVFYNPDYKSKGAFRENIANALFLISLSLYNPSKEGKLFVKRAVGMPGESVKFDNGNVKIKRFSDDEFTDESGIADSYTPVRRRTQTEELLSRYRGTLLAYDAKKLFSSVPAFLYSAEAVSIPEERLDYYTVSDAYMNTTYHLEPYSTDNLSAVHSYNNGIYIPENGILPLGDNRDNSADGRFFGPVQMKSVIGRGIFRFWPLDKFKFLTK